MRNIAGTFGFGVAAQRQAMARRATKSAAGVMRGTTGPRTKDNTLREKTDAFKKTFNEKMVTMSGGRSTGVNYATASMFDRMRWYMAQAPHIRRGAAVFSVCYQADTGAGGGSLKRVAQGIRRQEIADRVGTGAT
jgi:hypothetical protein